MIFPTRYHTFLYLTWFGRNGQSPGGGQMRFVGDFLALKVNATNTRNRFIHYEPANFSPGLGAMTQMLIFLFSNFLFFLFS